MLAADRTRSMPWDPAPQQMGVPTHRVPSIGLPYRMVMNEDTKQCELSSTMVRPYWVLTINPPGSGFDAALHYVPSLKFIDSNRHPPQAHRAATLALAPQTESKQRQRTSIGGHEISEVVITPCFRNSSGHTRDSASGQCIHGYSQGLQMCSENPATETLSSVCPCCCRPSQANLPSSFRCESLIA